MKILVLNCGSSSIKYKLISMTTEKLIAKGVLERIGMSNAVLSYKNDKGESIKEVIEVLDHTKGIKIVVDSLTKYGAIKNESEIAGVGHRVVHGGDKFSNTVLINSEVKAKIRKCIDLAPLHNPNNFRGINAVEEIMPHVMQVAAFDTAFHQTLPEHSYIYPLPYAEYLKHGIRRYGFHGMSHRYIRDRVGKILRKPISKLKIISCHLGNGASITAIQNGKSIDTSMGFTPLEGLVMGTRCGDIDPAIIIYLASKKGMSLSEVDNLLNRHSGMLGLSGISSDMREIIAGIKKKDKRALLAFDVYTYRLKKYIGAYIAAMNGLDALVFTAGVGENNPMVREKVCLGLDYLGIKIKKDRNNKAISKETIISGSLSKVKVMVIPTDEELVIARDTKNIITSLRKNKKK